MKFFPILHLDRCDLRSGNGLQNRSKKTRAKSLSTAKLQLEQVIPLTCSIAWRDVPCPGVVNADAGFFKKGGHMRWMQLREAHGTTNCRFKKKIYMTYGIRTATTKSRIQLP